MKRKTKKILAIVAIMIAFFLAIAFFTAKDCKFVSSLDFIDYSMSKNAKDEKREITQADIENGVLKQEKLISAKCSYRGMSKFTKDKKILGQKLNFGTASLIISYNGKINAGTDLSKSKVQVANISKIIYISIPPSEILSNELSLSDIAVIDEKNSFISRMTAEDLIENLQSRKVVALNKAINENKILEKANDNSKRIIENKVFNLLKTGNFKNYEVIVGVGGVENEI